MKKVIHIAAFKEGTETYDGFVGHFGSYSLRKGLDEATRRWGPPVPESKEAVGKMLEQGIPEGGLTYRTTWHDVEVTEYEVVDG